MGKRESVEEGSVGRWSLDRARDWQANVGWLFGCNFTPSTAGNQLEMWQAESFDLATIDRELGWAAGLGMNAVRVYLHHLLFEEDGQGLFDRIDQFFIRAEAHGIAMIPVLLDGVWHPRPKLGVQREPRPGVHNSMWVQSPGEEVLFDPSQWPRVQAYAQAVVSRFAHDHRVVAWDLFNEPDQVDSTTIAQGSRVRKAAAATELLDNVFAWVREVNPDQPLTVGVWEYDADWKPVDNPLNTLALTHSDITSFHCYEPRAELNRVVDALTTYERPLLCTEWLARSAGSTVDLLDVFVERGVGAINWGLVDGRTQTRYPWRSWSEVVADDEPWFHELLHADGTPYDAQEAELIRRLTQQTKQV